jgi:hypothetical protein
MIKSDKATQRVGRHGASAAPLLERGLPGNAPATAVSAVALAVMLLAGAPLAARAANECGADAPGQDTLTCSGASYATGITYSPSNGMTLNLANPAGMVVSGVQGVSVQVPISSSTTVMVNVTDVSSITASGSAVTVSNSSTNGLASVNIERGTLTSTGTAHTVLVIGGSSGGDAHATLAGGQVVNTGTGAGIVAQTSGGTGTGNATIVVTGGTVQTASTGVFASISGPNHTGTASIAMNGGSVTSTASGALQAQTNGRGIAQVQMTGGTVVALGANADGIYVSSRTGSYAVDVSGGTVSGGSANGAAIHAMAAAERQHVDGAAERAIHGERPAFDGAEAADGGGVADHQRAALDGQGVRGHGAVELGGA